MTILHKYVGKKSSIAMSLMLYGASGYAGGFSLYTEGSVVAIGNYAAGIAAEAADASIGWYNPAGLVLIKQQQALLGGIGVFPSTELTGTSTYTLLPPLAPVTYMQPFSNLQGAENAVVPSLHYALPLGERATFGLSIVSPFGLSTNYGLTSPVRYAATLSKLQTVNVAPELGGKLSDNWSIGGGLDLQYATVKFNSIIGSPPLAEAYAPSQPMYLDSTSKNSGSSFGVGFHAGVLGVFNAEHTRVGVNYQSRMHHNFYGVSSLTGRLADASVMLTDPMAQVTTNTLFSNGIELPDVLTISGYQDINTRLAILGSVVYTGWSSFNKIVLNNVVIPYGPGTGEPPILLDNTTIEDYRDVWRFAVGANYRLMPQWLLRGGIGYDQTPTTDAHRDVRLPDADRFALSIGTHYQVKPNWGFDIGYTYLFARGNSTIDNTIMLPDSKSLPAIASYNVNANVQAHAQLVGLQVVWTDQSGVETK